MANMTLDDRIKIQDPITYGKIQLLKQMYNNALANNNRTSMDVAHREAERLRQQFTARQNSSKSSDSSLPFLNPGRDFSNMSSGSSSENKDSNGINQPSSVVKIVNPGYNSQLSNQQDEIIKSNDYILWTQIQKYKSDYNNAVAKGDVASAREANKAAQQLRQRALSVFGPSNGSSSKGSLTNVLGSSLGLDFNQFLDAKVAFWANQNLTFNNISSGSSQVNTTTGELISSDESEQQFNYDSWSDEKKDQFIFNKDFIAWQQINEQKEILNSSNNIGERHEAQKKIEELRSQTLYDLLGPSVDPNAAPQYSISGYDSQRSQEQDTEIKIKDKNAWDEIQQWKSVYNRALAEGDAETALWASKEAEAIRRRVLGGEVITLDDINSLVESLDNQEQKIIDFEKKHSDYLNDIYSIQQDPTLYHQLMSLYEEYENTANKLQEKYQQFSNQTDEEMIRIINKQLEDKLKQKKDNLNEAYKTYGYITISAAGAKYANQHPEGQAQIRSLKKEIDDLEWEIGRNEQIIQTLLNRKQIHLDPNYEQLVEAGKQDIHNSFNQNLRPNENRVYFNVGGNQQLNEYGKSKNLLDYISEEDARDYYAFLGAGMKDAAELELERLTGIASMRRAEELLAEDDFNIWDTTVMSFSVGVENFVDGIVQFFTGEVDYTPSVNEIVMSELAPTLDGIQKVLSDIAYAVGYIGPSLLASTALGMAGMPLLLTQGISAVAIGISSGANSYKDALANGYSHSAAKEYGIINGVLEGGLQFALSGLGKLGSVAWQSVSKTAVVTNAVTKLNNVARALAGTKGMDTVIRAMQPVGRYVGKMGSDGFEEWLHAVADPIIRNNIFDENNNISPFSEEKLYAAMLGAMTAGLANISSIQSGRRALGGSDAVGHTPAQLKTMREYQKATDSKLMEFINKVISSPYNNKTDNLTYQLGSVTEKQAADIKQVTGVDVTGFKRDLTGRAVRHIFNLYSENGQTDKSMSNINDLGIIQYVIDNYDYIQTPRATNTQYTNSDGTPGNFIRYAKQLDGHYYIVEAVPDTKKKTVHIVTAYQDTNNQPAQQTPYAQRPWNNAQDELIGTDAPTIAQAQMNGDREVPQRILVDGQLRTILPRAGESRQGVNGNQQLQTDTVGSNGQPHRILVDGEWRTVLPRAGESSVDMPLLRLGESKSTNADILDAADHEPYNITTKTKITYKPTSGATLTATPGKTTTILGSYEADMRHILQELELPKSTDFGPREGSFNLLNTPDDLYRTPEQFWQEYNKPWLNKVIQRGDIIKLATMPTRATLYRRNKHTGKMELTGFGREITYLQEHGYTFDNVTKEMKPAK